MGGIGAIRGGFEVDLGASPATLPAGTKDLVGYATQGGRRYPFTIPVSALPSAQADVAIDSKNTNSAVNDNGSLAIRCTYAAANRQLTYQLTPGNAGALTSIRARG